MPTMEKALVTAASAAPRASSMAAGGETGKRLARRRWPDGGLGGLAADYGGLSGDHENPFTSEVHSYALHSTPVKGLGCSFSVAG